MTEGCGRAGALRALEGRVDGPLPVALLTWGFDYMWKAAGLAPWQLACGGTETWHRAHLALIDRHHPDVIMYQGSGAGPAEPTLLSEDSNRWTVRENNTGITYHLTRLGLGLSRADTGEKDCDPLGQIESSADADRLLPTSLGWEEHDLDALSRLVKEIGERALVLPRPSPGDICACYALGFEAAMRMMLDAPELFLYVCDRYGAADLPGMKQAATAGVEAVFAADSWASCDVISPAMFESFALPYQASLAESAHAAGLRIVLWNVGDIGPVLEREASLPIDAFAFEQPRKERGVTVKEVRRAFGAHRCLFGNLDSEHLLQRNDREEIRRAVHEQIRQSGPGAPFVLCTGSPLPSSIAPGAVDAMIRAARECNRAAP